MTAQEAKKFEPTPCDVITSPAPYLCRLAFASLFEKRSYQGGRETYNATVLIPPGSPDLAKLKAAVKAAAVAQWGDKLPKLSDRGNPIHECDGRWDGFDEGWTYVRATTGFQPQVVDGQRNDILDPDVIYSGCYCRFHLTAYAWSNEFGKGISFQLNSVQLVKQGEKLGGARPARDVFEPVAGEDPKPGADDIFG